MLFRESKTGDIDRLPPHTATMPIYSLWPGYLDRDSNHLASWCRHPAIALEVAHTSGHADPNSLVRLARALNPRIVVPIHTKRRRSWTRLFAMFAFFAIEPGWRFSSDPGGYSARTFDRVLVFSGQWELERFSNQFGGPRPRL